MKCKTCHVEKLSNEFPPWKLTPTCRHAKYACIRCVLELVRINHKCPYPGCESYIDPRSQIMTTMTHTMEEMFREYKANDAPLVGLEGASANVIRIVVLNGDCVEVNFNPAMTVLQLKELIKEKMKHDPQKQKFLYKGQELKIKDDRGRQMKLADYHVRPNSNIYLVVLLYAIPDDFDHVVFDLYWGYPLAGLDYLDASCLIFSGQTFLGVSDYRQCFNQQLSNFVHHSGDVMDEKNRTGHHTINVKMKNISLNVTHLFFTLSAWNSPDISKYRNPSLKFYEADKPDKDLCNTTFTHAHHSTAVIMCSVSRSESGWVIYKSGQLSTGNAKLYQPIIQSIQNLIAEGF